jgi:hypothetical protein
MGARIFSLKESDQAELQNRYAQALQHAMTLAAIRLEPLYKPNIAPVAAWLPAVERRIRDSIKPHGYENLGSTEWLGEDVGQAAIRFFQNAADILPGEPFIYASHTGALVAEFKNPRGALTTLISPDSVILFAVKADEPGTPVHMSLKRSNTRLRDDIKQVVQTVSGSHGQTMGTAR